MDGLKGLDELVNTLKTIKDRGVKKAAKAGINAALQVAAKQARADINSSGASANLKKDMRTVIAKYLKKQHGEWIGRIGIIVTKKTKVKLAKLYGKQREQEARGRQRSQSSSQEAASGFGNPVWWVLGTAERATGKAHRMFPRTRSKEVYYKATGSAAHKTGKITAPFPHLIRDAIASCEGAMLDAAQKKVEQVLAAEAAKARKG